MERLNSKLTNPTNRPIVLMQFGEGNFLRAFVDYMVDIANEKGLMNAGIVLVKPISFGSLQRFNEQDNQYTVQLRGRVNGNEYVETRKITSVVDTVCPFDDYQKYIDLASVDTLRFIVSNTTEAGIVYHDEDEFEEKLNNTYPAKLTQFLYERYKAFNGDLSKGLIILPVELIDDNGIELKKCVFKYVSKWNLEEGFSNWLNEACVFTSTLVDRIVTGYPFQEAESIWQELGYEDQLLDTAEPFALWVIESDKDISLELPLDKALEEKEGMNVIFTDNQKPYKQRKVRILNGAHTSFVLASYLKGNDYVNESMNDELMRDFMMKTIHEEVIPTLTLPYEDLKNFADAVVDRFNNPFIKHALLAISLNSVSKWKARCMPSFLGYIEKYNKLPMHLTFSIASLMCFYSGEEIVDGVLKANRNGNLYDVKDDQDVLEFFLEKSKLSSKEFTAAVLSNTNFWGQDLSLVEGLQDKVSEFVESIRSQGVETSLKKYF